MTRAERAFNLLAGVSVISWAVLGMVATDVSTRLTVVRIGITILNLVVGSLFLLRRPIAYEGDLTGTLLCLPSILICGIAFKLTPPANIWPVAARVAFAAGTLLAVASCLCLGRCFAVLPAMRGVVVKGPYRIVRHPIYVGEFLMILGCFLSDPQPLHIAPLAAAVPLLVVRIRVEERLLQRESAYREYADSVRWRLLPGVW